MTKATDTDVAQDLLNAFHGGLSEGINNQRKLTETELYALLLAYRVAKPHLTPDFEAQWCGGVLTEVDFEEIANERVGNARDTYNQFISLMIEGN